MQVDPKVRELVRYATPGMYQRGRLRLELLKVGATERGDLQVLFRAWRGRQPIGFGLDGSCEIERLVSHNPPILYGRREGHLREGPTKLVVDDVARIVRLVGKYGPVVPGRVANTTFTGRPAAGAASPVDGWTQAVPASTSYASLRADAGLNANVTNTVDSLCWTVATTTTSEYNRMRRSIYGVDTSSIPDGDSISSGTFQIEGTNKGNGLGNDDYGLVSANPASPSTLAAGDFAIATYGSTEYATRITQAGWSTSAFNTWTLNASGLAYINKTGNTFFGVRSGWDLDASAPWVSGADTSIAGYFADQTGTASDPVLTVEHAPASVVASMASDGGPQVVRQPGPRVSVFMRERFRRLGELFVPGHLVGVR